MRQLLVHSLKRLRGVQTEEASDGLDALKKIQQHSFDLIITDINMPLMDGFKLLAMIRTADQQVPIVVLTTEGSTSDRDRAMNLGANAFITKPVQAADVRDVCVKMLPAAGQGG